MRLEQRHSTAAVLDGVAGELAGRGDDLRLIDEAEAETDGQRSEPPAAR